MSIRHVSRFLLAAAACGFAMLAWSAEGPSQSSSGTAASPASASTDAQSQHYWGFLKEYCSKCHNTDDWAGGIAFETMSPAQIPADADTWEKAINHLNGHLMPPPGHPQPPQASVDQFVQWMAGNIDHAASTEQPYTGSVALHRLNRKEYANAVWDCCGSRSIRIGCYLLMTRPAATTTSPMCCRSPQRSWASIFRLPARSRSRRSAIATRPLSARLSLIHISEPTRP